MAFDGKNPQSIVVLENCAIHHKSLHIMELLKCAMPTSQRCNPYIVHCGRCGSQGFTW